MAVDVGALLGRHPLEAVRVHVAHGLEVVDEDGVGGGPGGRWEWDAPGMRSWCGCGWRGLVHEQLRVHGSGAQRRAEWWRVHRPHAQAVGLEWQDHVREVVPTLSVLAAVEEVAAAERALHAAVHTAREGGASWAEVAAVTGTSKQSAHQRWGGSRDVLLPEDRRKGGRPRKAPPATVPIPVQNTATDPAAAAAGDVEPTTGEAATGGPATGPVADAQGAADGSGTTSGLRGPAAAGAGRGSDARGGARAAAGRSSRSEQMRALARRLSEASGVSVAAEYDQGRGGGWRLWWTGGPTRAELRALAERDAAAAGGAPREVLEAIDWYRSISTDTDAAAAVLAWMSDHPDEARDALSWMTDEELGAWPDRLPTEIRTRAAALVAAGWRYRTAGAAADQLAAHAERGWPAVAAWLDQLATEQDADVVDLHAARGRTPRP